MDYEFLRDITGVVKVRMSMGHEVVGHWFNEEVKENLALLDEVEQAAHALKGSERSVHPQGVFMPCPLPGPFATFQRTHCKVANGLVNG